MNKRQYKKHIGKYGLTYREVKESHKVQEKYRAEHNRKARAAKKPIEKLSEEDMWLVEIGVYTIEELLKAAEPRKHRHRAITKVLDRKR